MDWTAGWSAGAEADTAGMGRETNSDGFVAGLGAAARAGILGIVGATSERLTVKRRSDTGKASAADGRTHHSGAADFAMAIVNAGFGRLGAKGGSGNLGAAGFGAAAGFADVGAAGDAAGCETGCEFGWAAG